VAQAFSGVYAARNRALFMLGGQTGFRISALLSLRVGDVWPHGRLVTRVSVRRRHMKGKVQGRSVVLLPAAQAALAVWLTAMDRGGPVGPGTYLFRSRKGLTDHFAGGRPVTSCARSTRRAGPPA